MGTFGERLQREREMRGITLEEIAEATKIGTRSLRALEEQDFDKLPGGIFNKGFVRAYSKYLGIDEDQAVADYVTAVNEAQSTGKLTRPEYAPPAIEEPETASSEPIRIPWALLIIVALIVAVGFAAKSYYSKGGWAKLKREGSAQTSSKAPEQAPVPAVVQPAANPSVAEPVPAETSGDPAQKQAETQPAAAVAADGFVVKVRAREASWVWIKADGKVVANETLQANTDRTVHAEKQVILVTENAGGIEVSHNDKLLAPIGEEKQKKTVVLTAQGLQRTE